MERKIEKFDEWVKKVGLDSKEYQKKGLRKMLELETAEEPEYGCRGGFLTDEMGLGKTIQMLGLILCNDKERTLIVMPRALIEQWEKAIIRFLGFEPAVFHGNRKFEKDFRDSKIVITTYGLASTRITKRKKVTMNGLIPQVIWAKTERKSILQSVEWSRIIFDEAHHMRNPDTGAFKGGYDLRGEIRWFVTGTPIQNSIGDLCSLLRLFRIPKVHYETDVKILKLLRHFNIGRTKKDVGINLEDVKRHHIKVEWESDEEKNIAIDIHSGLSFPNITVKNVNKLIGFLTLYTFAALVRCRQICIDGRMLRSVAAKMVDAKILNQEDIELGGLEHSSKLNAVLETIRNRKDNGNNKIIFTHFRHEIDYLQVKLRELGLDVEKVDGRTSQKSREKILTSRYDVLLLQIQASCEGLNLQEYNEIHFTSPHWNPAVVDQAIARAHRIGQRKLVEVFEYEMCSFGDGTKSIDKYCFEIQKLKRKIAEIFK
jgi:SNF2 family DNA or RNA helicase